MPPENVLQAALDHGIWLDHACGGFCACSSCHIHVEAGMDHTADQEDPEADQVELAQGLGFMKGAHVAPGTRVVVKTGDETTPAVIEARPFWSGLLNEGIGPRY